MNVPFGHFQCPSMILQNDLAPGPGSTSPKSQKADVSRGWPTYWAKKRRQEAGARGSILIVDRK